MGAGAGGATNPPPPGRCGSGGGGPLASDAGGAIDPPLAGGAAPHQQRGPAVEAEPGQRGSSGPQGQPAGGGLHEAGSPSAPEVRQRRLASHQSEATTILNAVRTFQELSLFLAARGVQELDFHAFLEQAMSPSRVLQSLRWLSNNGRLQWQLDRLKPPKVIGKVPGCGGGTAHAAHPGGPDHRDAASPRSSLDSSAVVVARGFGLPALQAPVLVHAGEGQQGVLPRPLPQREAVP